MEKGDIVFRIIKTSIDKKLVSESGKFGIVIDRENIVAKNACVIVCWFPSGKKYSISKAFLGVLNGR